jgi:SAM-dependent methyltransferase
MNVGSIGEFVLQLRHRLQHRKTFEFRGFAVDSWLAESTGAPEEHYEMFAALHEELVETLIPVEPRHVVLEAGCGTGMDAMLLTDRLSPEGRYTGFDIAARNVRWCTARITKRFPNFRFHHFDIRNETYNRRGRLAATSVRFPERDGVVDRFIAQSVFTHLLSDVTAHYFHELRRVLRPEGRAMISCFVGTPEEIKASLKSPMPIFRFIHEYSPGVFVHRRYRPSDSVAYERRTFERLLAEAGLTLTNFVPGYWAQGRPATHIGQDIVVLAPTAGAAH